MAWAAHGGYASFQGVDKRSGLIISAVAHAVMAGLALFVFGGPRPFEAAAERSIIVDVMTPQEAAREQAVDEQATRKIQEALRQSAESKAEPATPPQTQQQPSQQTSPKSDPPSQDRPDEGLPSIDAGELLPTYNLRLPTDIDARKAIAASLTREEIAGLKAHLRKCWRLPGGVAANSGTRVVMRVPLSPAGALAGEPTLVEASAAQDGPAVMRAALAALEACAPYAFLPRNRYKEWRVLDVTFSPREMGGG